MKRILLILGAGLIGLMHPAAAHATLLDFTFSFTGTVPPGTVAGTVTGEIFGLTEGITSSATNVMVDSYPVGLEPPSPPQSVFTDVFDNSFTVSSMGAITAADFFATTGGSQFLDLLLNPPQGLNEIATEGGAAGNVLGFAGVTYTLVTAVPEPSSVTLLGIGLGAAALWQLRRRRQRGAAA
jgi:hypothetical protein